MTNSSNEKIYTNKLRLKLEGQKTAKSRVSKRRFIHTSYNIVNRNRGFACRVGAHKDGEKSDDRTMIKREKENLQQKFHGMGINEMVHTFI